MKHYPQVLTIAGSDSSGGAGIQADLKAISACGGFGMSAITVITSQNTVGVQGVFALPEGVVRSQVESVMSDLGVDAAKIGMLGSPEIARSVVEVIKKWGVKNVVLDPVLVATSGDRLTLDSTIEVITEQLMPLCTVITPNIEEAEKLSGIKINSQADYPAVWQKLHTMGAKALLIKGGHGTQQMLCDVLFTPHNAPLEIQNQRIDTPNTHGTGCTLSAAMATLLARGFDLPMATTIAIEYLHQAILSGAQYQIGHGHGAVNHFWKMTPDPTPQPTKSPSQK